MMLNRLARRFHVYFDPHICRAAFCSATNEISSASNLTEEEFEKMSFLPASPLKSRESLQRKRRRYEPPPRYKKMPIDQDWNSVWPSARTFNPNSAPFPLYQSGPDIERNLKPRLDKFNNPELMKIQNFLHLAPTNIKKQCAAIKKFCSPWPKDLENEHVVETFFPLQITTSDYCHASPTIRDSRARVVTLTFNLSKLELDDHSRDKMIRLLGPERYCPQTDTVKIITQACPLRIQNLDYALYQLTACYFESWKTEEWESSKEPQDWEAYFWEKSSSRKKVNDLFEKNDEEQKNLKQNATKEYAKALENIFVRGESNDLLDDYRKSVEKILFN